MIHPALLAVIFPSPPPIAPNLSKEKEMRASTMRSREVVGPGHPPPDLPWAYLPSHDFRLRDRSSLAHVFVARR